MILPDDKASVSAGAHKDISRFSYDISRMKKLGFKPTPDLLPGIKEVLDFLEKH